MTILGISFANFLGWVILGLISGTLFHYAFKSDTRGGVITTTIFGIIGALLAGLLVNQILGFSLFGFDISNIIAAILGSLLLAAIAKVIFRDNRHIKTDTTQLNQ